MTELLTIGVDPGPVPGIVALRWSTTDRGVLLDSAEAFQCTPGSAPPLVAWLLRADQHPDLRAIVQVERFVVGKGSGVSRQAGAITRDMVGAVTREVSFHSTSAAGCPATALQESAGRVKAWATDDRLAACQRAYGRGLLEPTKGMRHARDAARHALFAAVTTGAIPDPLSNRTRGADR